MTITLADRYAAAKMAFDDAEAALDALKAEVKALGMEKVEGITCDLALSLIERKTFSSATAKQFLTDDQIKLCEGVTDVYTIRVKAKGLQMAA